ncbi:MAG: aldehyde ferredoxin oxidoreductase C-terminal domain-containing protein [Chloroflexi bacterium]|nr:aldehyde ferredoxin oxidoreductase C-terminal domain-containing protein [Chloroflexota bacterium]
MRALARREAVKTSCYNCQQKCIRSPHTDDGQPIFIKCRSSFRFVPAADIQDYDFNLHCVSLVQRNGLDSTSAAALCAFAIDLYQKGILTKEDTDGLHLEWGNPEVIPALLDKIVRREGIGDVLANGVYQAAQQIGRGAEQYAYHFRKLEPRGQTMKIGMAASYLLSDRRDNSKSGGVKGLDGEGGEEGGGGKGGPAEAINRSYPADWKKYMSLPGEHSTLSDCLGICYFWLGTHAHPPMRDLDQAQLALYATGMDTDEEGIKQCVRRARALIRAYNSILGERMTADDLPAKFFHDPAGILPSVNRDDLSKAIEETNRIMGYTAEGIPTEKALHELGLDYVARELDRRGILPKPVSVPVT